jgi:purine catabolism regulator
MALMPLTVGDLLKTPGLPLKAVAGLKGLDHPIRWVHVSELDDPTPWLKGGELLLVTGMGIGSTPARQRAYVNRLVETGLAGLGFGLGFSHQRVPKALVEAAEAVSFPVFEVPYVLPFIAITEAVFTRLVAEQYDLLSRSLEAEHTLTRAVLEGQGPEGVVSSLTSVVGGWAILLDLHGAVVSSTPATAKSYARRIWGELQSSRPEGIHFSLSLVDRGQNIAVQPVSSQGRVEAYLAVGKKEALTQFDRIVSSHAIGLLAIELAKVRAVSETERRLRGDALEQILSASLSAGETRRLLERLGFDLSRPVAAVACSSADSAEDLAEACEEAMTRRTDAFLCSARDGVVVVVLQPEGDEKFVSTFRSAVA